MYYVDPSLETIDDFILGLLEIPSKMNTDGLYSNERMKIFFDVYLYGSVGTLAQGNETHDIVWVSYLSFSANDPL